MNKEFWTVGVGVAGVREGMRPEGRVGEDRGE